MVVDKRRLLSNELFVDEISSPPCTQTFVAVTLFIQATVYHKALCWGGDGQVACLQVGNAWMVYVRSCIHTHNADRESGRFANCGLVECTI